VEVRLLKPHRPLAPDGKNGAVALTGAPGGREMGRIIAGRGHMTLLPKGSAYQFHADQPSVVTIQTVHRSGQRMPALPGYLDCLYPQSKDRWQGHESYLRGGPERTEDHRMMVPENWAEMSVDEKADWLGLQECDYLLKARVSRAKRFLALGELPIAAVALDCGFCHQEHLTRVFRRHCGVTPGAYRASVRG
jgi:Helix-turn-helix domain